MENLQPYQKNGARPAKPSEQEELTTFYHVSFFIYKHKTNTDMAILHTIKAWLYENLLTPDPNDFHIRPIAERTLSVKEICEAAYSRGSADIHADAMEHAVNLFLKEMGYQLCDGYSVNTGWFTARPQVRGIANSPMEQYNKEKHTLLFEFHQGAILRKELENVTVAILGVADTEAAIEQVTDVKTGSINDLLTPDRNLRIAGYKIKLAGDGASIHFVNQATFERIQVDASEIVTNNPSEIMIVIPSLSAGQYQLEITTQYGGNNKQLLKAPRTVIFDHILTVG
jgi:hypothetical protein